MWRRTSRSARSSSSSGPSTSLKKELANLNVGNSGYAIVSVAGLGDEAAAAFQKADPSKGLQAGMATLAARSGGRVVSLSGGFADWKRNGYDVQLPRMLSPEKRARYSRHIAIPEIGEEGQLKPHDSRVLLRGAGILYAEGWLQQVDGVTAIRARRFAEIRMPGAIPPSHDFH